MSKNQKSKPKENSPSSLISLNRNQIQNLNQRNRIGFLLCKPDNKSEEGININRRQQQLHLLEQQHLVSKQNKSSE